MTMQTTDIWEDRRVKIGYETAEELAHCFSPDNWRGHPEVQADALDDSLDLLGWVGSVKKNVQTNRIFDGHLRVTRALVKDPALQIPVDYYDLTPDEELLALQIHDAITEQSQPIPERLAKLLERTRAMTADRLGLLGMLEALRVRAGVNGASIGNGQQWTVTLDLPEQWNVGLIVGPSGSGKTTVARELFGDYLVKNWTWPDDKSIVDGFPTEMSIKDITGLLSSVGFSSPPSWVRPFRVLSNGEQFRVNIARTLAEMKELAVVDEFTSVVDRTVAQIGSAAIAKTVRKRQQRFIAVSCHYDIADWLEPDWVYQPHTNELYTGRYLYQRPKIELEIKRVHHSAWQLFRKHHYLDTKLHMAAVCFCAFWKGQPVAFTAILHFPHPKARNIKREHRTVCLPDFQGVGIGNAMSDYVGAICKGAGLRFQSQTSHPAMIRARNESKNWAMIAKPNNKTKTFPVNSIGMRADGSGQTRGPATRFRASFEYIGPPLSADEARRVWSTLTTQSRASLAGE